VNGQIDLTESPFTHNLTNLVGIAGSFRSSASLSEGYFNLLDLVMNIASPRAQLAVTHTGVLSFKPYFFIYNFQINFLLFQSVPLADSFSFLAVVRLLDTARLGDASTTLLPGVAK